MLNPPATKHLKLSFEFLHLIFAFKLYLRRYNKGTPPLPPDARCSPQVRSLLASMLNQVPSRRHTVAAVLKHPALKAATLSALRSAANEAARGMKAAAAAGVANAWEAGAYTRPLLSST